MFSPGQSRVKLNVSAQAVPEKVWMKQLMIEMKRVVDEKRDLGRCFDESYDDALMRREGKQLMRRGTMKQGGLGVEGERVERGGRRGYLERRWRGIEGGESGGEGEAERRKMESGRGETEKGLEIGEGETVRGVGETVRGRRRKG